MRTSELLASQAVQHAMVSDDDLLEHAGYIQRLDDGLYSLLPLGHRVAQRITAVIRRQFEMVGGQEITMPLLQPLRLWEQITVNGATRAEAMGEQLFRIGPRTGDPLVLAPTHEEVAAAIAAQCILESRHVPRLVFQIQPRFRDHKGPLAAGLLRTREFLMMDGYSFDAEPAGLDARYDTVRDAFQAAVTACGAHAEWAVADPGAMGGGRSEELIAPLSDVAYEAAWRCSGCGATESAEIAAFARRPLSPHLKKPAERVEAPEGLTVQALALWLGSSSERRLTWSAFVAAGRVFLAVTPADVPVHPVKLRRALSARGHRAGDLHLADVVELRDMNLDYDDLSPVAAHASVLVVADEAVGQRGDFHAPSSFVGWVLNHLEPVRDFRVDLVADIGQAEPGAACSDCGSPLDPVHGIEVGHIFKLGVHFSVGFDARVDGRPLHMGCYGLGITRLLAVVAAQNRDAAGLVWPAVIAPYAAVIVPLTDDVGAKDTAGRLYGRLRDAGLEVLLDDDAAPAEQRAAAAKRLGIPLAIGVRSGVENAVVEIRERATGRVHQLNADGIATNIQRIIRRSSL
jgi:prolyl-tRNA synthetase